MFAQIRIETEQFQSICHCIWTRTDWKMFWLYLNPEQRLMSQQGARQGSSAPSASKTCLTWGPMALRSALCGHSNKTDICHGCVKGFERSWAFQGAKFLLCVLPELSWKVTILHITHYLAWHKRRRQSIRCSESSLLKTASWSRRLACLLVWQTKGLGGDTDWKLIFKIFTTKMKYFND